MDNPVHHCTQLIFVLDLLSGSTLLVGINHVILHVTRHRHMLAILHGELTLSLGHGPQGGGVSKHVIERYKCIDDCIISLLLCIQDHSLGPVQGAHNISLELIRDDNSHIHHRLHYCRATVKICLSEGAESTKPECEFTGIHRMCRTIFQHKSDTFNRISNERATIDSLQEAFLNGWDEARWNVVTDRIVHKFKLDVAALLEWFNITHNLSILSLSPALLLVYIVEISSIIHSFTEVDTGLS
mmetsp:Transcript_38611/g.46725  ORF Transcript_38611/g.46725 Transcript_38611/m.46725 type:complete len:242 (-) Transcript_38611:1737-2462(-)